MKIPAPFKQFNNIHFLSLLSNGAMGALSLFTLFILLHYLPTSDVGYWFFFQSIFVLLDTLRSGFLQVGVVKFYSGSTPQQGEIILGSAWYLSIFITIILVLLNLLAIAGLPFIHHPGIIIIIKWFGFTFICTLPSNVAAWILQAEQKFYELLILRLINQGVLISLILMAIVFNKLDLNALFIINIITALTASVFCFIKKWTKFKTIVKRSTNQIKELFHFGKYGFGTSISSNLLRSSDTFIIMFVLGPAGPAAVTMYTIPMRFMELIEMPLRSVMATAMPAMSAAFNKGKKEEVVLILQKFAGILAIALIPISITAIIFANYAIVALGGLKYMHTNAVTVFRIFISFAMIFPIDRFIGVTLDIINKPRINFFKVLIMLVVNVLFDFTGLYLFGNITGVAIATFLTFMSGVCFGYYWLKKYLDFSIRGIFKSGYLEIKFLLQHYIISQ